MSSKCTKIVVGWDFPKQTHWGAYSASSNLLAVFKLAYFKGPTSEGEEGNGR